MPGFLLSLLVVGCGWTPPADDSEASPDSEPDSEQATLYTEIAGRTAKEQALLNHQRTHTADKHKEFFSAIPAH